MDFCHLHVHSEKSWFDSVISIPHLLQKTRSFEMNAIGLTDHHHMMGWIAFEKEADKKGVQPVFGMELNVGTFHLTALAMNEKGIENLLLLNNLGRTRGKVFVTEAELIAHKEGLFVLSGCTKGMLYAAYYRTGATAVAEIIDRYNSLFPGAFAIELSTSRIPQALKDIMMMLAEKKGIPLVPTNDCHYLHQSDKTVYINNLWLRTRGKIVATNADKHFKTTTEMQNLYPQEWLAQTMHIAKRCRVSYLSYLQQANKRPHTLFYPLSYIERYNDEESIRMVYESQKDYRKAKEVSAFMKRGLLTLEDLIYKEEYQREVQLAFGIRHTIKNVRADERYLLATSHTPLPLFQTGKKGIPFLQWTLQEAVDIGAYIIEKKERTSV